MNWTAVGAIGELLGALAVVATLLYLAAQVREGQRLLQTTVREGAFQAIGDWNMHLSSDKELAYTFHRGVLDYESLDDDEKAQFGHTMYAFMKAYENLYNHYKSGTLEVEVWEANEPALGLYARRSGLQLWFDRAERLFDPNFVVLVRAYASPKRATPAEVEGAAD